MYRRLALLTAFTLLVLAAPALAQPTFTPACASNDACLGLALPAEVDSVVVAWRIRTTTEQTVRLRSTQTLESATATTATSAPIAIGTSNAVQSVPERLPIAAGGELELLDATGTPQFEAILEADGDGDGYGDSTQDACTSNAADHTSPCNGTATIGSPLTLAPDPHGFSASGNAIQALQLSAAGTVSAVPKAGVLTTWRLRAQPGKGDTILQLLRPTAAGTSYAVVAETEPVRATSTDVVTVADQLAVKAGDRLAVRSVLNAGNRDLGAIAARAADELVASDPPKTAGQTWTPNIASPAGFRLLVQADVEPDVDQDGKGDVTQDSADLVLTGSAPAAVANLEPWSQSYTVRNAGPDVALDVVVKISGGVVVPGTASAGVACDPADPTRPGGAITCKLAKLAAGASVSVTPAFIIATIYPPLGGTFATQATVTALTRDPDTTNNAAALKTVVASPPPYLPYIPPTQPFVIKACTNIIRGTRDDDVVRGTAFGDRLVGGDGDDLLKGQGADDCLEGGTGNDVLDGGDGNDRLAGSSGRDRLSGGTGDDKLTGGKGNDRLTGGPGNDTISPGSGRDVVNAGGGNDTINSVDGVKETIDCGAGRDTVRADKRDRLKHCEKVTRKR
jgi:Ca2+-binding RTX toxin-like protein